MFGAHYCALCEALALTLVRDLSKDLLERHAEDRVLLGASVQAVVGLGGAAKEDAHRAALRGERAEV